MIIIDSWLLFTLIAASTDTPTNGAVYILFCFSLEKFTVTVATENAHKVVKATINGMVMMS